MTAHDRPASSAHDALELSERDHPRVLEATVWTHPLGLELRMMIDGTLLRSQVLKTDAELLGGRGGSGAVDRQRLARD